MAVLSTVANVATPGLPVGSIQAFAGANAPTGWLLCDGSAVGRGDYADLFNTIGTTYGSGNGATTFNLPDLRGRVPAGKDNMGGTSANRLTTSHFGGTATNLGASGGSESHTLTTAQLAAHNHGVTDPGHVHQYGVYGGSFGDGSGAASLFTGFPLRETRSTGNNATNISIQNNGSGNAHNNTQPTLIVNYIIKAVADIARGGWYTQSNPPVVTQLPTNPTIGEEVYHLISGSLYNKRWDGSQWQSVANDLISDQVTYDKIATSQTNWAQNTPSAVSVNTTTPTTIATVTFTSRGRGPVLAIGSGDANPAVQANWHWIALYLNGNQVNPLIINQTAGASWNNPFAIVRMLGVLSAGNHTIQLRAWQGVGEITYGETGNNQAPSLVVVELI